MSELEFPLSDLGAEPFRLGDELANFYRSLPATIGGDDGNDTESCDDLIRRTETTFRLGEMNAGFYESIYSLPDSGPPNALCAISVALAYFVEAHYAHKAGETGHGTKALLRANYYLGVAKTYDAFARNAKKGGQATRDKRIVLVNAAIAAANSLIGRYKGKTAFKYIALAIANDPRVKEANEALGKEAVENLATTLENWTSSDSKWPDFRAAVELVKHASKNRS